MSHRSFTVFKDVLVSDVEVHKPQASRVSNKKFSSSASVTSTTSLSNLSSVAEKENLHPVTGEFSAQGKKRKTLVLATKSATPLATKQAESLECKPEPKRRKSSTTVSKKSNSGAKKERKPSGTGRKAAQSSSRKLSPLPRVEEAGESERESERITLADIDSRCYELTVKPLADVSQAYYDHGVDRGSVLNDGLLVDEKTLPLVKEPSAEPEIRDYFSPSLSSLSPPVIASSTALVQDVKNFSTPERKQIYAAFTFASPSQSPAKLVKSRSVTPATVVTTSHTCETS